jgi:NAD(P)-dependent dehydrogenase (short-subunit alcohol dehydrogenase family)
LSIPSIDVACDRGSGTTCRRRRETTGSTTWLSYDDATAEFSLTEKGRTAGIPTDVRDAYAARATGAAVRRAWKRLDILVNNAGILSPVTVATLKAADLDAMLRVNLSVPSP